MVLKKQHMSKYDIIAQHKKIKQDQKQVKMHKTPDYVSNLDKMVDKFYKLKKDIENNGDPYDLMHFLNSMDSATIYKIQERYKEKYKN